MKLLLTNDDGWDAPGLKALTNVAAEFGEVFVVAPLRHQSGISHQMTFEVNMSFEEKSPFPSLKILDSPMFVRGSGMKSDVPDVTRRSPLPFQQIPNNQSLRQHLTTDRLSM